MRFFLIDLPVVLCDPSQSNVSSQIPLDNSPTYEVLNDL